MLLLVGGDGGFSARNNRTSSSRLTSADVWASGSRSSGKKRVSVAASKKSTGKVTKTLKDVIFVNDPNVFKVPRKAERSFRYKNDFVALAVKLHSKINEGDIRLAFFPEGGLGL